MHVQSNRTRTRVHLYCTHSISASFAVSYKENNFKPDILLVLEMVLIFLCLFAIRQDLNKDAVTIHIMITWHESKNVGFKNIIINLEHLCFTYLHHYNYKMMPLFEDTFPSDAQCKQQQQQQQWQQQQGR